MKKKIIALILSIILILLVIFFIHKNKITKLEKVKITEFSNDVINYIDEIYEYDDEGKYISFAIEYLYNKNSKNIFTNTEILNVLKSIFNKEFNEEYLNKIGISNRMADKGITYSIDEYTYNNTLSKQEISNRKIYKYSINKISKKDNKYIVKYDRYVVDNPYNILNYYEKENINNEKKYDTSNIKKYLDGDRHIYLIKESITKDNINDIGKIDGNITIIYIIKDNKLLIGEIK